MGTWARTGPVVVEVGGSAEGLRVVDYACLEAIRSGAELVLAAPYQAHNSFSSMTPGYLPKQPAVLADDDLRAAIAHVRRQVGHALALNAVLMEGSRLKVLPEAARHARLLVVGRTRARGPHRLVAAQSNLLLAARTDCPLVVVPMSWKPSAADRNVAVGVDGTSLSLEAVEFAFRTAADREGDLTVVHAEPTPKSRGDLTVAETLAGWSDEFPEVRVTRFLTARPVVAALMRESQQVGLIVLGAHPGPLPIGDPVARRAIAAMTCPIAVVPHHLTAAEREARGREIRIGADVGVSTY
jgi:nucleotide-binding universal stress UspA family protein